ncbi:glycosyltransferase family 39 protein [Sphingobium sp.]|uniref:ArnT family glycosyltransferase n=1 Tax=Sphingobium sp. TaxID=1912891 RepID=UPI0026103736|nr:glycosyltransferase family 39 protein [Sphingobium sp.]
MQGRSSAWVWTLASLLLAALVLRLASIRFGLPALNDPDELMFELGALKMLRGPTLNPGWFGHPATTTMYILAIVNVGMFLTGWVAGWWDSVRAFGDIIYSNPAWIILPGRVAMTMFSIGVIFLTYRLGARLIDRRAGILAALLLAVSPVHITWSQIIRSDMMACFFLLLVMNAACNIIQRNRPRDDIHASLWLGTAIATKWPFALGIIPIAFALLALIGDGKVTWRRAILRLGAIGGLSLVFLLLLSPYLALDYSTVVRNLTGEGQIRHLGSTGGTAGENALWYIRRGLWHGLGPVAVVLMPFGLVALRKRKRAAALILPLGIAFFLLFCLQTMVWERWALPLLPLAAIISGAGGVWLVERLPRSARPVACVVGLIALVTPPLLSAQIDARERLNDTRQLAAHWARKHIPAGSVILVEHFAFDLLPQPWHFLFPIGDAGCIDARALLQGKTTYGPIDQARGTRANIDYGTMAASQRPRCRPDFAILTQYDRYRREANAFPAEYAAYRSLLARGRVVASFDPQPGLSGGRNVTIVDFRKDVESSERQP